MTQPSPNIVLVIMDDLAWGDLACHGNPVTHTPNLDRLHTESSHLTRYCSGPLCSPARASLMTGRYHLRTRVLDTYCGRSTLEPTEWTLAQALQGAGYHTGAFGKWHLGDNYPSRAMDLGFDETLVHRAGGIGQPGDHPDNYPRWHTDSYFDPVLYHNGQPIRTSGYCTDIFFDTAMHFIDRHQDGPFFAYIATNAPHTPLLVGDEWTDRYRKLGVNETHARLYGMVENIDWNMGRLLAQLADLGVADNTIVIYTSDHGPCGSAQHNGENRWNGGLRGLKGTMYEGGIRVPCFWRWPGHLPVCHDVDSIAHPIDVLPTLLAACDLSIPEDLHIDGVNLLPILRGDVALEAWPDRPLFMQWHRGDLPVRYRNYAVITQRHKLYRPHENQVDELYDIEDDPLESQDRAAEQPEQVAALRVLYDEWLDEMATTRGLTTFDPLSIPVGTPHENPVLLTQNDWRILGEEGWNQDNLRGYWSVSVAKAQTYTIQVRFRSGLPSGVVHLRLGDETRMQPVKADQTQLSFDGVLLNRGKAVVECWLETDQTYSPAYFRRYVPALYVQFEAALIPEPNQGDIVMFTYTKQLPIIARPDVLVCGAGLAGIGAAVAAARSGARTMVIERMGFAGGFFTAIIGSAFDGFVDERSGAPVVGGIVFEMLERMGVIAPGQGPDLRYNVNGDLSFVEMHPERVIPRCDPERFKRAADDILTEAGVQILYHSQVTDVVTRDGRVETVLVSNKAGLVAIQPQIVIDCTGDGDVAAWAGAPYEKAEPLQPMSLHFRIAYLQPSFELRRRCAAVLQAAHQRGEIGLYGGPYPATFSGRDVYFNATRFPGDSSDPDDWTQAEIQGRKDAWTMFNLWQVELPEFAESYFMTSGPTAGARESRRILGDYVLTGDDVAEGRRHDDVIVLGAWRLDRHPPRDSGYHEIPWTPPYDIPYRTLLPRSLENVLVAGRCHSATSEALASSRVTATAMGMGQAAGVAAAMAVAAGRSPREVAVGDVQSAILRAGGILEAPQAGGVNVGNPRW